MRKKILILGAGVEQIPAIREAEKMGLYVIASDMNPEAPGRKYADKFYQVSTTDIKGNIKVAEKENISGVMTVSSETAVVTVAEVASAMGLPGFSVETAIAATNKEKMREVLQKSNVNVSPFVITDDFKEAYSFTRKHKGPWVFKPVDSSGQRGTTMVFDDGRIQSAFFYAAESSRVGRVLIDRFIAGQEYHVTMQVVDGEVNFLAVSDRITLDAPNFGIAVRHIAPSDLNKETENSIKSLCVEAVKAVKLENGVATCEVIVNNDIPYLMEIAIRVPGGYLREVAMYFSGIDIIKTTIWNSLGLRKSIQEMITEDKYNAVSVKFVTKNNLPDDIGEIVKVNKEELYGMKNIKSVIYHFDDKLKVPELNSSVGRFAVIIGVGDSVKEAVVATENVFNKMKINGKSLTEYKNYNKHCINFQHYLQ
ncbi:MAG: ATP-grasp domain-containing protein [Chlorobi bacterium]|nr:ATP-grasp domain-containing protein [Chlorobiota bacterium]